MELDSQSIQNVDTVHKINFVKIVATILFVTLPFAGFWMGMKYQSTLTPKFQNEIVSPDFPTPTFPNASITVVEKKPIVTAPVDHELGNQCQSYGGSWSEEYKECANIKEDVCTKIGGKFLNCVSPCRHEPKNSDRMCITLCVEICQL